MLDTEVLFGLRARDKHHRATDRQLKKLREQGNDPYATDSALLEWQSVLRSLGHSPAHVRRALLALKAKLVRYGVVEARTLGVDTLALQAELEEKYALSYFDSLIAASAMTLDRVVVSDDRAFDRVADLTRLPLSQGSGF